MLRSAAILALALSTPAAAVAQGAAAKLPQAVLSHVAGLGKECRGYGGVPGKSPQLMKIADLNGDGLADYAVDVASFNCEGAPSAMGSGQSGAGVTVFAGGPGGGAAVAFQDVVYGVSLETAAGKPRLFVTLGGRGCGQRVTADTPFSNYRFCDRPLVWNAAKRTFDYSPLSQARMVQ